MVRATNAIARRRRKKKLFDEAKGFRGSRKNIYRVTRNAVFKARQHAFEDRRRKKRLMRRLWIVRINAAIRPLGLPYNRFINGLRKAGVELDRRVLAEMAVSSPEGLRSLVTVAVKALERN